jgi:hypothetical protein
VCTIWVSRIYEQETCQCVQYGFNGYTNRRHARVYNMGFTDIRTGDMPGCAIWVSRIYEQETCQCVQYGLHGCLDDWSDGGVTLDATHKQSVTVVIMKTQPSLPNALVV